MRPDQRSRKYTLLLSAILCLFVLEPFLGGSFESIAVWDFFLLWVIIAGTYTIVRQRSILVLSLTIGFLKVFLHVLVHFTSNPILETARLAVGFLFFGLLVFVWFYVFCLVEISWPGSLLLKDGPADLLRPSLL
jgi:hypothetical protein